MNEQEQIAHDKYEKSISDLQLQKKEFEDEIKKIEHLRKPIANKIKDLTSQLQSLRFKKSNYDSKLHNLNYKNHLIKQQISNQKFEFKWVEMEKVILQGCKIDSEELQRMRFSLESFLSKLIKTNSDQFCTVLDLYEKDINQWQIEKLISDAIESKNLVIVEKLKLHVMNNNMNIDPKYISLMCDFNEQAMYNPLQ